MAKSQRADAVRNRKLILKAAYEQLSDHGIDVPVDQIAAAAKVGTGTLYRHFPSKHALIAAVLDHRTDELVEAAARATMTEPDGQALFSFATQLARDAGRDQALLAILTAQGIDPSSATDGPDRFLEALRVLLVDAQKTGLVRRDLDVATLKVLLSGYQAMALQLAPGSDQFDTIDSIVRAGIAPPT